MATEQVDFWAGQFGEDYIIRNKSENLLASNLHFFAKVFATTNYTPTSFLELGANIGMNGRAIKLLFPEASYSGLEINVTAHSQLSKIADNAILGSIEDNINLPLSDVTFTKGVLIHLNPESLTQAYATLYETSKKYILVTEYFNPTPTAINYRGHENKLFKRDFAQEILSKYSDLTLISYGFNYHGGQFPLDDSSWFLMEKRND